jgi:hypothetical protein
MGWLGMAPFAVSDASLEPPSAAGKRFCTYERMEKILEPTARDSLAQAIFSPDHLLLRRKLAFYGH